MNLEFTIRVERPRGTATELRKIRDGWCDYGFYAFADRADQHLLQWTIYRLDIFRDTLEAMPDRGDEFLDERLTYNEDGSSWFAAFKWDEFPPEMIVAQKMVQFVPCDKPRCYFGKEWYEVPEAPNRWRICTRCLGLGKVPVP